MEPVLVAGGGIGGLGAALALARAGFAVELFERSAEFRELGAGIQLGPNGFAMFDRLGVRAAIDRDAVQPAALVMRCAVQGHEITRIPLEGMPSPTAPTCTAACWKPARRSPASRCTPPARSPASTRTVPASPWRWRMAAPQAAPR